MNLYSPFLHRGLRELTGKRGFAYERAKGLPPPEPAKGDGEGGVLDRLDGPEAIPFGTLADGRVVRVRSEIALRSGFVLGASASGKSRMVTKEILTLIEDMAEGRRPGLQLKFSDGKGDTVTFLEQQMGFWLKTWPELKREWLRQNVRVLRFNRHFVSPMPLFDNRSGKFSDPFVAEFRTQVTCEARDVDFPDGVRYLYRMYSQLLTELSLSPDDVLAIHFFTDPAFRGKTIGRLRPGQLRSFFENLENLTPRATITALLRRLGERVSCPEIRAALCVPLADLDRLGIVREARVELADFGGRDGLPPAAAREFCLQYHFDTLLSVPQRNPNQPLLLIDEEFADMVAGSPKLVGPVIHTLRCARSFGVGLLAVGQDMKNAIEKELMTAYVSNARYVVAFQCREEASWLAPHLAEEGRGSTKDADRRRAFQREIEGLPPRHFRLWVKGEPVLRCTALDLPDPEQVAGCDAAELQETFDREIASRSMLSVELANELIAKGTAEVLRGSTTPSPPAMVRPPVRSMDDLLSHLEDDGEDEADA